MSTNEPAAILAGIKERYAKTGGGYSSNPGDYIRSAEDVPLLLAAVEAVLRLTDKPSTGIPPVRIRETIRAALAGEGTTS